MSKYKTLKATSIVTLTVLIQESTSKLDLLRKFGFTSLDSRALLYLKETINQYSISTEHWTSKFKTYRCSYSKQDLVVAVQDSLCITDVLRALNLSTVGANSSTIRKYIKEYDIDTSHFSVSRARSRGNKSTLEEDVVLCRNSNAHRGAARRLILSKNLLPYVCNECNITKWNGHTLTLDLDHKDGNSTNNELDNLRFLCPNCHSLTSTYRGKNNAPVA